MHGTFLPVRTHHLQGNALYYTCTPAHLSNPVHTCPHMSTPAHSAFYATRLHTRHAHLSPSLDLRPIHSLPPCSVAAAAAAALSRRSSPGQHICQEGNTSCAVREHFISEVVKKVRGGAPLPDLSLPTPKPFRWARAHTPRTPGHACTHTRILSRVFPFPYFLDTHTHTHTVHEYRTCAL